MPPQHCTAAQGAKVAPEPPTSELSTALSDPNQLGVMGGASSSLRSALVRMHACMHASNGVAWAWRGHYVHAPRPVSQGSRTRHTPSQGLLGATCALGRPHSHITGLAHTSSHFLTLPRTHTPVIRSPPVPLPPRRCPRTQSGGSDEGGHDSSRTPPGPQVRGRTCPPHLPLTIGTTRVPHGPIQVAGLLDGHA